ncbi:hypothetical protein SFUMM280S_06948 [Streptomyces fumanus]
MVVTEAAAAERAEAIGTGLAGSMTLGVGQFCVKPGLVLVPSGAAGDGLVKSLTDAVSATDAGVLLDHRMRDNFVAGVAEAALPDVEAPVTPGAGGEHSVSPGFLTVPAARLAAEGEHDLLLEECFGPVTVVARYQDEAEAKAVLSRLPGNLTATVQLSEAEAAGEGRGTEILAELTPLAGRVLVNGWPTGVAVAPAQHHGGPYPATTSTSTSVGGTAIELVAAPGRVPERAGGAAAAGAARRQPAGAAAPVQRPTGARGPGRIRPPWGDRAELTDGRGVPGAAQ